jgi:hypothetical protein
VVAAAGGFSAGAAGATGAPTGFGSAVVERRATGPGLREHLPGRVVDVELDHRRGGGRRERLGGRREQRGGGDERDHATVPMKAMK